ncbi:MAG: carboxypeptidase-like regulatory domain-containing protein [Bacteroidota bacterium]
MIKGVVRDAETNEPIPFAHVIVENTVTLTNLDGQFILNSPTEGKVPSLEVSVIGYQHTSHKIGDFDQFYEILLTPSTVSLGEVTVLSGETLIDRIVDRFHLNYEMSSHHMIGYYKEDLSSTDSIYYIAEGIVDIYVPSNVDFDKTLVSPIRTRKKVFRTMEDHLTFLKGNASDMAKSSIWRKDSFLSQRNRKNYDFFYNGVSTIGNQEVYVIEFEPNNSKGDTKGTLYVEEESLAILKMEYQPITDGSFWTNVSWVEEFSERGGLYELLRVSYQGSWEEYSNDYTYKALLVANKVAVLDELPKKQDHHLN